MPIRGKKEMLRTVKSKSWYWKGNDIFGEERKNAGEQKRALRRK